MKLRSLPMLILTLLCTIGPIATAHNKPVHEQLAEDAMQMTEDAWTPLWLPDAWKQAIRDGSWQEDYTPPDYSLTLLGEVCRTRNHGYNPITSTTGGLFIDWQWLCPDGGEAVTARQYAESLWDTMCTRTAPTGDDGTYHYLGRLCHLLQDMSSFVHVHPQDVTVSEHSDFEAFEVDAFDGVPLTGIPVKRPTDPLDPSARALLDAFTVSRLESKQFNSNDIGSFMETVARITYFRGTFWGEVVFVSDDYLDDGDATAETTSPTSFTDLHADAQPNILRTMFGPGKVRYINGWDGDDYFAIEDSRGNSHTWGGTFDDEWFPCTGATVDGHRTVDPGGGDSDDPWDEQVRTTGRFFFKEPWGAYPANYPDATTFGNFSLGYYIALHAMRAGTCYNAGLMRIGAGPLFGDFNRDGYTDIADLQTLAAAWLTNHPSVDVTPLPTRDQTANFTDFERLSRNWLAPWH